MLNRVVLIGRLATDPELKYTPSGIAVTQFRIAVDRPMSAEARQSGQQKEADFISIVAWRQSAEFAANYLGKGRLVAVDGRLQIREYVTQDGQKRRDAEVVADNLKSLDRPKEGAEGGGGGGSYGGGGNNDGGNNRNAPRDDYDDAPAAAAPAPRAASPAARPAAPARPTSGGRPQPAPADDDMDDPFADN